jgi:mannosyltransferase OCH1-like enzyme
MICERIMQTFRRIRQLKYLIKAIIYLQYPRKNVYDFMNMGLMSIQTSNNSIPKNCYISWKTNLLVKSHYTDLQSFVISNPDFNFYFFTDDEQDKWMKINMGGTEIYDIYKRVIYGASRSDIFRTCLLEKFGGVFFSINRLIQLPLKDLVGNGSNFVVSFDPGIYKRINVSKIIPLEFRDHAVIQWGMFSPPHHQILQIAISRIIKNAKYYSGREFSPPKEAIWNFDGPYMLTRALDEYLSSSKTPKITIEGFNYNNSMYIPRGAIFRYAVEPSYLGDLKGKILKD